MVHRSRGVTLLEILVVVAMIAVIASLGTPPVAAWSCKRQLESDFSSMVNFYLTARSEAVTRSQSVMVQVAGLPDSGYQLSWGLSDRSCASVPSTAVSSFELPRAELTSFDPDVCFHADQTASGTGWTMQRSCGATTYAFRSTLVASTGYLQIERKVGSAAWEEQ